VSSTDDDLYRGPSSTNQDKTESVPPTPGHAPPAAAVDPEDMNVGGADPQAPSHPHAAPSGDPVHSGIDPLPGGAVPTGSEPPSGTAQRVPGSLGVSSPEEEIETDLGRSVASLDSPEGESGPGDAAGVPVGSEQAAPGTSQESGVAQGSRTPE
jgi:hypothetical protein